MAVTNTTGSAVVTAKLHTSTTNYSSASATVSSTTALTQSMSVHHIITVAASKVITMSATANSTGTIVDCTLTTNSAGATTI